MLDNFGNENEIVVLTKTQTFHSFDADGTLIGEQIDGPEGLFYSDKRKIFSKKITKKST